jgi:hypothetical protein
MVAHRKVCLRLRRQAARGTADRAHVPSRRSSRAPLCRRRLRTAQRSRWRDSRASNPAAPAQVSSHGGHPQGSRWVGMNNRLGLRCSCLRACGLALRTGNSDNTHCAFVPSCLSHYFILFTQIILTREPLLGGTKLRTMWRCLCCRCGAVTGRAARTSHSSGALVASAARSRASLQASFPPTTAPPTKDHRVCLPHARRCGSHPPPIPNARPLPSPRGRRSTARATCHNLRQDSQA